MSEIVHLLGLRFVSRDELWFIIGVSFGVFLIMAYMIDLIMERLSFGIILNTILMFLGASLGLLCLNWLGMPPSRRDFTNALLVCGLSSVLLPLFLAAFKRSV
jgi:hypothetical protein